MERAVLDKSRRGWWKSAVFYELYPKSFQDTTGSGTGDLRGILSHLDHLETLGVDAIWLCPICASPQVDNGYDISDFCAIEPSFGTMADMDELIAESKKRGIGILIDLTLNHCSDQHRWFRAAKSSRDNPYHDYFLWRDGTPDCPPSGMRSVFGGSAWTYVPEIGQWYFHQFAPEQPDMNWENPKLRQELYDVMKFWVKKGVAGFRLDVIDQIAKEPDKDITINGPRLHEYLRGISENVLTDEGLVTVGEAWGADTERAKRYSAPDGSELSMVFQFEHIGLDQEPGKDKWDMIPLELPRLKECLRRRKPERPEGVIPRKPAGKSIEKRPEIVNTRTTFGHWEMDSLESGKGYKRTWLMLTERKTRREIIVSMKDKTSESVVRALNGIERKLGALFPQIFLSITCDNGTEFSDAEGIENKRRGKGKRTTVYYCHPYTPSERGTNENQNGLIRRLVPKGTDLSTLSPQEVKAAEAWLNSYPRKMFGFLCSEQLFREELALILAR